MTHEELVERVLEKQDLLTESLWVRKAMQELLNSLLRLKDAEVSHFAAALDEELTNDDRALKKAWADARHALANPSGLVDRNSFKS